MNNINETVEYFQAKKFSKIAASIISIFYLALIGLGIVIVVLPNVEFKYGAIGLLATCGYGIYGLYQVYRVLNTKVGISESSITVNNETVEWGKIVSAEYRIASYLSPVIILLLKDETALKIPAIISELDYIKSKIEKKVDTIIRKNK